MYTYKTKDSRKVEDIDKYANEMSAQGYELFIVTSAQDRYVSVYRKPKS